MTDIVDKVLNLGIGALVMTKERAEDMVNDLIKMGEVRQEEGKKMVEELLQRGEKKRQEMKDEVRKIVRDVLAESDIPTRYEVDALKNEVVLLKESKPNEGELFQLRSEIAQIKAKLNK